MLRRYRRESLRRRPGRKQSQPDGLVPADQRLVQRLEFARLVLSEGIIMKVLNAKIAEWLAPERTYLQSLLLLIIRLYWGWGLFDAGEGELMDVRKSTAFFQSLGIQVP